MSNVILLVHSQKTTGFQTSLTFLLAHHDSRSNPFIKTNFCGTYNKPTLEQLIITLEETILLWQGRVYF